MQKCLILLAFVSYEAVRLWWWGGNGGVVDFGNIPWPRSIPTLASNSNCVCSIGLGGSGVQTDTKTDTNFPIRKKPA